jgi:hypothetical protein
VDALVPLNTIATVTFPDGQPPCDVGSRTRPRRIAPRLTRGSHRIDD